MPDESRAFQPPIVPDLVIAQVFVGKEREVTCVQAALRMQAGQRFFTIGLAEWLNQAL